MVVIADNCSDNTAAIAATEGAEVVVRTDLARRGKGYALDFGVRYLESKPPDVILIVDADCHVSPGTVDHLVRLCCKTNRPVQAIYLMQAGPEARLNMRIAEFAWLVKNKVRPEGLNRLGLPCQLTGTGMAFPWGCLSKAMLATGHIVEDLKLGLELARAGAAPLLCPQALVTSNFPTSADGIKGQRTRWEHGHLSVILSDAPRLFLDGVRRRSADLLALALDLCVPPTALLALLVAAIWTSCAILFHLTAAAWPLALASLAAAADGSLGAHVLGGVRSPHHDARHSLAERHLPFVEDPSLPAVPGRTAGRVGALQAGLIEPLAHRRGIQGI